jgi:hypothetical protein
MSGDGLKAIVRDNRDHSYHRTFGSVGTFPQTFNTDAGFGIPNQDMDGFPNGCTGYTQASIASDEDKVVYKPYFTYEKTLFMGNEPMGAPCDLRDSLKSTIVYGLQRDTEKTDEEALQHRRGRYFNVQPTTDWFDGIRSAIYTNNRSVSMGTSWFIEFNISHGFVDRFYYNGNPNNYPRHNYKACGWTTKGGDPYLKVLPWQGRGYGKDGFLYFSRDVVNKLMSIDGSGAFTFAKAKPEDIQNIRSTTMQVLVTYLLRVKAFLSLLKTYS